MNLPSPRSKLADCVWLPRIVAKARLIASGDLPAEYAERFCHPTGIDFLFLNFFELSKADIVFASEKSDSDLKEWFLAHNSNDADRILRWNSMAENLGRPGFPLAERLALALGTSYRHLDPSKITSAFDALELDDLFSQQATASPAPDNPQ